jgi:hypothetical protein
MTVPRSTIWLGLARLVWSRQGRPVVQQVPADLDAALKHAIENYEATWQQVDTELYNLCRRRPNQRTFADVYAKVSMIGRVYVAGIAVPSESPVTAKPPSPAA